MQQRKQQVPTLRKVWADYQVVRKLKTVTVRNYDGRLNSHLKDWLDLPVTSITKDMIEERYLSIKGKAVASSTMRTLRALLHYAMVKYDDQVTSNPVKRLTELRMWHRDRRRKTVLSKQDLKPWVQAVYSLDNAGMRDFFLLLLFTGMRKSEALELRWSDVNLAGGTILLQDTKNGEDFTLPLSDFAWNLLILRKHGARSEFVFPNHDGSKPIVCAERSMRQVQQRSGVTFCLHDLRRTFVSIADDLDIKSEVCKQLLNHKSKDVTEGYVCRSTERLRRASQQITDAMLQYAGIATNANSAQVKALRAALTLF